MTIVCAFHGALFVGLLEPNSGVFLPTDQHSYLPVYSDTTIWGLLWSGSLQTTEVKNQTAFPTVLWCRCWQAESRLSFYKAVALCRPSFLIAEVSLSRSTPRLCGFYLTERSLTLKFKLSKFKKYPAGEAVSKFSSALWVLNSPPPMIVGCTCYLACSLMLLKRCRLVCAGWVISSIPGHHIIWNNFCICSQLHVVIST